MEGSHRAHMRALFGGKGIRGRTDLWRHKFNARLFELLLRRIEVRCGILQSELEAHDFFLQFIRTPAVLLQRQPDKEWHFGSSTETPAMDCGEWTGVSVSRALQIFDDVPECRAYIALCGRERGTE